MQQTPLSQGNAALRNKDYEAAIRHYNRALAQNPELAAMLQSNIDLAYQRGAIPKPAAGTVPVATVDIVVPVYNALEDVKKCLESLQRCTDGLNVRVIVVNDGSDESTTQWLREYCGGEPVFKLIEHEKNTGYTKAVNTGLKATTADFIIAQNSDTIVSPGWLTGLIRCMSSSPTIGIVGPLSNAAGWQNVPDLQDDYGKFIINDLPAGYSAGEMARMVKSTSVSAYPRLPFINGFCFMIKRDVIESIGLMDDESFPIGYGEENDYCIRASDAGFNLAVADDVFVFHSKSKSFGSAKRKELTLAGGEAIRKKHTQRKYHSLIEIAKKNATMETVRKLIKESIYFPKTIQITKKIDTDELETVAKIKALSLTQKMEHIAQSGLFDSNWYLAEHADVAKNPSINPLSHFTRNGGKEMRNPGPNFNTAWYLKNYPDAGKHDINPLLHFLTIGKNKGYKTQSEIKGKNWALEITGQTQSEIKYDIHSAIARMNKNQTPVAIIIPVFNALKELKNCIRSVLTHTKQTFRLLVIDDASTDPNVGIYLMSLVGTKSIEVYKNDVNLGFTRTVNKGIEAAGISDVVFLNSDTIVTPNWLINLKVAAYHEDRTGTATPYSNNAGAYSAPEIGKENHIPNGYSLDEWARAINQSALRIYPNAPTGHGFCMYIRRDCLKDVGALDAEAFPRGYGEENDFCMRAVRKGWKHVVDQSTYIYHVRSASFGEAKTELLKQGRKVIDQRYPEYTSAVRAFITQADFIDTHDRIRKIETTLTQNKVKIKPRVLYVLATKTGGTPQTNQDLMNALGAEIETFVLFSNAKKIDLYYFFKNEYFLVDSIIIDDPITVFPHRSWQYDKIISNWLAYYSIELIHIRHLAWHSLGLVDSARTLGIPIVFSLHDFYTVCPTVKLLDAEQTYCGGKCTASETDCKYDLWKDNKFPKLKKAAIHDWRMMFESIFQKCDHFVTTNTSAKSIISHNYTALAHRPFSVIPHGRDFTEFIEPQPALYANETIKLLVPGNITNAKGGLIINELAKRSKELNIEIHILGKVAGNVNTTNCVLHGEYNRDDFVSKVKHIKPHIGCIFSIWPETHCHTLTELWAAGLPTIGFNIGAVGDRIARTGAGWLINEFTADTVGKLIENIRIDARIFSTAKKRTIDWQNTDAERESCEAMASQYAEIYSQFITMNK